MPAFAFVGGIQGGSRNLCKGAVLPFSPSLLLLLFLFPPPPLPLEVGPLKPARWSGGTL